METGVAGAVALGAEIALESALPLSFLDEKVAWSLVKPFRGERWFYQGHTPACYGLDYQSFTATVNAYGGRRGDGRSVGDAWAGAKAQLSLRGWIVPPATNGRGPGAAPRGTVVLLHGVSSCKEANLWLAQWLAAWGYRSVLYDGRGHGESGGEFCTYGYYERHDVSEVLDEVEAQVGPLGPVALWGTSYGAAVTLQALEHDPRIRAGIAESSFATLREVAVDYQRRLFLRVDSPYLVRWTIDAAERLARFRVDEVRPEESARRLTQPVLLVHGTADQHIAIGYGRRIFANLRHPGSRWLPVSGGTHHLLWLKGGQEYERTFRRFLEEHLAG